MAKAHDTAAGDTKAKGESKGEIADEIHETTEAVRGDLTKLAGPKAGKAIQHWETVLEKLGPSVKGVHGDLGKLREHVTADKPDGAAIGKLLGSLSKGTLKAAEDTGGVVGKALTPLGHALEKAGKSLAAK